MGQQRVEQDRLRRELNLNFPFLNHMFWKKKKQNNNTANNPKGKFNVSLLIPDPTRIWSALCSKQIERRPIFYAGSMQWDIFTFFLKLCTNTSECCDWTFDWIWKVTRSSNDKEADGENHLTIWNGTRHLSNMVGGANAAAWVCIAAMETESRWWSF